MPCVRHLPRCTDCSPRPYEEVHRALARRAAEEGIILLKNENHTLPLPSGCRIALYGTGALHTLKGGTGSGDVNARETVSIRDGLYAAGFQIANEAWLQHCDTIYRQARSKWRGRVWEQLETGQQPHFFAAYVNTPFQAPACAPAKAACDAALYVLSRSSGEGADRKNEPGDYLLSKWEMQDLRSLCSFYPRFAAAFVLLCNFCVGSNVFLAKGLSLCYTYFKQKHFSARRGRERYKQSDSSHNSRHSSEYRRLDSV